MSALSSPALVGRQEELLVLEAALAGAAAGEPALVVIGADAGAGKTRLVDEAGRRARSAGARLLSGTCLDIGQGGLPFGPVIEALRRFAQETSEEELVALLGPAQAEVHRLLPDIVAGTAGSDADGTDQPATAGARARLFELLLGLLGRAGETAPTLVVIEDVHWIDTASRGLLTFLAHNLSRERVLIVVTHRTDGIGRRHPLHEYLAELERHPRVRRLRLPPLRVEETERQLAAILGADPPIDLVGRIQEQAEGNPFYAEELLSAWQAGERVMPRSLRETLSGRLAALEAPAGRLVAAAAVAGRSSDERLLATVAELPPQAFLEALREAVDREILVPDEARGYRFRHALLRQAALDELLPAERRSLHARVAAVLDEDRSLSDPSPVTAKAELAYHWASADLPIEAVGASLEAAAAAEAVYAFDQAHREYERALALWDRVPAADRPPLDEVELLRRAAESANLSGDLGRAIELVEQARASVEPESDPLRAATLSSRLGYLRWASGASEEALEAHLEALRLAPPESSPERARILGGLAGALMGAGRYRESAAIAQDAVSCAREVQASAEEARALNVLGSDLVALGASERGLALLREALGVAKEAASPDGLVVGYHNLAVTLVFEDRLAEALEVALEGREAARRLGLERRFGGALLAAAGDALFRLGRWDEAEDLTREALTLDPSGPAAAFCLAIRAQLLAARGRLEEAGELLTRADATPVGELDPDLAAYVAACRAELAEWEDRPEDAREEVRAALERLGASDIAPALAAPLYALGIRGEADRAERGRAWRSGAEVSSARDVGGRLREQIVSVRSRRLEAPPALADEPTAAAGRAPRGAAATAVATAVTKERALPAVHGASALAYLDQAEAEWSRLLGRSDPPLWAAVAGRWAALALPYPEAYARYREAEALLRSGGGRRTAEASLQRAHELVVGLKAELLGRVVRDLARRARVSLAARPVSADETAAETEPDQGAVPAAGLPRRPASEPRRPTVHDLGLSPREIEVLTLIAAGRTNGQIAEELFISPKTAGVHVTHILDKLAVSNRVEAAMVAARLGLAGEPDDAPGS